MAKSNVTKSEVEIATIKIGDNADLVIKIINEDFIDIRKYVKSEKYSGPTKQGVRFFLYDDIFSKFMSAMSLVKKNHIK